MSRPESCVFFQRLSNGVQIRDLLENPSLSLRQIFIEIVLAFNNGEIVVTLPNEAYDLEYIHFLETNDESRISIERDHIWTKHIWEATLAGYNATLSEWNGETIEGSWLETEFERWADDKEKFVKYGIDMEEYDHLDIENRPLILFSLYFKTKKHIWLQYGYGTIR